MTVLKVINQARVLLVIALIVLALGVLFLLSQSQRNLPPELWAGDSVAVQVEGSHTTVTLTYLSHTYQATRAHDLSLLLDGKPFPARNGEAFLVHVGETDVYLVLTLREASQLYVTVEVPIKKPKVILTPLQ